MKAEQVTLSQTIVTRFQQKSFGNRHFIFTD